MDLSEVYKISRNTLTQYLPKGSYAIIPSKSHNVWNLRSKSSNYFIDTRDILRLILKGKLDWWSNNKRTYKDSTKLVHEEVEKGNYKQITDNYSGSYCEDVIEILMERKKINPYRDFK